MAALKLVFKAEELSDKSDVEATVKPELPSRPPQCPGQEEVTGLDRSPPFPMKSTDPKVMQLILKIVTTAPGRNNEFSSGSMPSSRKRRTPTNSNEPQATSGHTSPVWNPDPFTSR